MSLERSQGFLRGTYKTKESAYSKLDLYTTSGLLPRAHNTKYVNLKCRIHERIRENLNNSIFSQVAEPHVPKCFPGANNCDVCAKTFHARDVISKSMWKKIRSAQNTGKKQTSMLKWMFAHVCPSYPFWPGRGALLLKVRTVLCLNLGGAFLSAGVATSAIMIGLLEEKKEIP